MVVGVGEGVSVSGGICIEVWPDRSHATEDESRALITRGAEVSTVSSGVPDCRSIGRETSRDATRLSTARRQKPAVWGRMVGTLFMVMLRVGMRVAS
jgi:hypothetical protein